MLVSSRRRNGDVLLSSFCLGGESSRREKVGGFGLVVMRYAVLLFFLLPVSQVFLEQFHHLLKTERRNVYLRYV